MQSAMGLARTCDSKLLSKCSRHQQVSVVATQPFRKLCSRSKVFNLASGPSTGRPGAQHIACAAQHQQHHQQQQLHSAAGPFSSSSQHLSQVKGRSVASCLAAAAQEQPTAGLAEAAAVAVPEHNSDGSSSNGTDMEKQASSSSSEDSSSEQATPGPAISTKVLSAPGELNAVAQLRADAYYEVRIIQRWQLCQHVLLQQK